MKKSIVAVVIVLFLSMTGIAHAVLKDNGDGTITDTANGFVWLKDANCFGKLNWNAAKSAVQSLQSGKCGLTDKSTAGQWRLPVAIDLASRSCSTAPFSNVQPARYWTSQMSSTWSGWACYVDIPTHSGSDASMSETYYVWPVR